MEDDWVTEVVPEKGELFTYLGIENGVVVNECGLNNFIHLCNKDSSLLNIWSVMGQIVAMQKCIIAYLFYLITYKCVEHNDKTLFIFYLLSCHSCFNNNWYPTKINYFSNQE